MKSVQIPAEADPPGGVFRRRRVYHRALGRRFGRPGAARQNQKLRQRLARKNVNIERLAAEMIRRPGSMGDILAGLDADTARVRFGSAKVLQIVSERSPEILYPRIGFFIDLLDTDNRIIRWNAILIISNLAAVDSKRKIGKILDPVFFRSVARIDRTTRTRWLYPLGPLDRKLHCHGLRYDVIVPR